MPTLGPFLCLNQFNNRSKVIVPMLISLQVDLKNEVLPFIPV
jgi:hypothetical protein